MNQVYQNIFTKERIVYPYKEYWSLEQRSMLKFKRKLYHYSYDWSRFITLTYNDKNLERILTQGMSYGKDLSRFINKLRNHLNRYLKSINEKGVEYTKRKFEFTHYVKPNWRYAWKYEIDSQGKREFNPHFHILINCGLDLKAIQKMWGVTNKKKEFESNGYSYIKRLKNKTQAVQYISKYMSKESTIKVPIGTRRYSTSRNVSKQKSKFRPLYFDSRPISVVRKELFEYNSTLNIIDNY